jgi:hypothetical protein
MDRAFVALDALVALALGCGVQLRLRSLALLLIATAARSRGCRRGQRDTILLGAVQRCWWVMQVAMILGRWRSGFRRAAEGRSAPAHIPDLYTLIIFISSGS